MATLSQLIMNVPGLSGSSFQRQQQYWNNLGLGNGYAGSLDQNNQLLGALNKPNYGISAPAPAATSPSNLAQGFANQAGAGNVYQGPVFSQVLPFDKAWGTLLPTVQAEGESNINPVINRQLNMDNHNYANQLASEGGGRIGRAWGNFGTIGANAEQQRRSQLLDWINQRQQGFNQLFYQPAQTAFNKGIELGQTPTTPKVPTYDEFMKAFQPSTLPNTSPAPAPSTATTNPASIYSKTYDLLNGNKGGQIVSSNSSAPTA